MCDQREGSLEWKFTATCNFVNSYDEKTHILFQEGLKMLVSTRMSRLSSIKVSFLSMVPSAR